LKYIDGFLSIGHCEDWDIVQRPGHDDVFVVEGSETSEDEMERYPTVYHFIFHEINVSGNLFSIDYGGSVNYLNEMLGMEPDFELIVNAQLTTEALTLAQ
jgi:hypothetical protein